MKNKSYYSFRKLVNFWVIQYESIMGNPAYVGQCITAHLNRLENNLTSK